MHMKDKKIAPVSRCKNDGGFTLIEVLVAIVILTIGLLGMATLTVAIIHGNKLSNDLTTATTLAQDKMEDIRREGYDSVGDIGDPDDEEKPVSGYPEFERVTSISGVGSPAVVGMKKITVTVTWSDQYNPSHTVTLETILSQ